MAAWLEGCITVIVVTILCAAMLMIVDLAVGAPAGYAWAALAGAIFGFAYGLQAGFLQIYALARPKGWVELVVDTTWSLPNTLIGFLFGNLVYPWFGDLSKQDSKHAGWIVYQAPASQKGGFGKDVLQIWGTVNIGGSGQHERMHLLQARIFGPLYLPLFALNYVVNFLLQSLWTFTLGGILWLVKVRQKPYFRPGSASVLSGFFGWIYYATVFEFWAYKAGNP